LETKKLKIGEYSIPVHVCNTLVIGSGAASLNCADHLYSFGVRDIIIATEELGGGTSNRSGSDKQTYYKLSLFGDGPDSVYEMAKTLFAGGCMHGDIALTEATMSAQEFYHLVHIGVPFPHNHFGGYVGYKTDHDPRQRATSAGPWTSNQMFEKLLGQVCAKGIEILDRHEVVSLITIDICDERRVIGAIALNKSLINSGLGALVFFQAENIIMGTGGPGGLYATSVYPEGHLGSTGIAIEAGAQCVNLTEWQYGLASTKFRWNLSGTYQQVVPRYISTDQDGNDEREFLNDYFSSMGKLATNIFLKGYQWPFDPRKIENFGSSIIDVLVYYETVIKGRRVFMDFTRNPSGGSELSDFLFSIAL
jgi:succinate dehydrogenase/fumarate reductase flavoprotein subunit